MGARTLRLVFGVVVLRVHPTATAHFPLLIILQVFLVVAGCNRLVVASRARHVIRLTTAATPECWCPVLQANAPAALDCRVGEGSMFQELL